MAKSDNPGSLPATKADLAQPTTAEKVAVLRDPATYPHRPEEVEVEETHMSWVFLAGPRVYKLKKPVRYPFLDFSTLEARRHAVTEELRLNRRLAPDVYLGATALSRKASGALALGEQGDVVDWLVTMRRLPREQMLDHLITRGGLTEEMIERLAQTLAEFFASAAPARPDPSMIVERYLREHRITSEVLLDPALGFDGSKVGPLLDRFTKSCQEIGPLLEERVAKGRIVDGHGDLRPEHVCLTEPVAIIDCLEFNRDLRLSDPFEEIAFLGLECALLGAKQIFPILRKRCEERLGERPPSALIAFYWRYRALLRARLSLAHLLEPAPRTPEKWRPLALRYLALAQRDIAEITPPDALGPPAPH